MGLSWQQGPLAPGAVGRFLVPDPLPERLLYAEPLRRRMRVRFGGTWIADSEDAVLLHEPGRYRVAYFPLSGIAGRVLEASQHTTRHRDLGATSCVNESALTPVEGQTFCPYKGLCSYYDIGDAHHADGPAMVRRLNIDGDGQGDLHGHGGEQRAALVYQIQSIDHWEGGFQPGPDPERCDYATFADFADPDGNTWVLQEIGHRPLATATSSNAPP